MKTKMSAKNFTLTALSLFMCIILILTFAACKKELTEDEYTKLWKDATYTEDIALGEGESSFLLEIKVGENTVTFTINTDEDMVGAALLENKVVSGDDGPYGLYVKYVNGIYADYDTDSAYWAFQKDGELIPTGVDTTEIENGAHYEMVYTKG